MKLFEIGIDFKQTTEILPLNSMVTVFYIDLCNLFILQASKTCKICQFTVLQLCTGIKFTENVIVLHSKSISSIFICYKGLDDLCITEYGYIIHLYVHHSVSGEFQILKKIDNFVQRTNQAALSSDESATE